MTKIKYILFFIAIFMAGNTMAQGNEKAVIFTGIVVGGAKSEPLPKANILNISSGRGTVANENGYFILSVFPGDSIIFTYIGYKKQFHKIPSKIESSYSAIVDLKENVQTLAEVKVYPYATEDLFKEAFINYTLPDAREREALAKATDERSMAILAKTMGIGSAANHRNFMTQQQTALANRSFTNTFSQAFLNPLAWASFIQSVKKGDITKKDWKGINDVAPMETIPREKFGKGKN